MYFLINLKRNMKLIIPQGEKGIRQGMHNKIVNTQLRQTN